MIDAHQIIEAKPELSPSSHLPTPTELDRFLSREDPGEVINEADILAPAISPSGIAPSAIAGAALYKSSEELTQADIEELIDRSQPTIRRAIRHLE